MTEALGTLGKIVVVLALVAALTALVWTIAADETEDIQDPSGQIDYSQFGTKEACEAIGGTWGGTPAACTG